MIEDRLVAPLADHKIEQLRQQAIELARGRHNTVQLLHQIGTHILAGRLGGQVREGLQLGSWHVFVNGEHVEARCRMDRFVDGDPPSDINMSGEHPCVVGLFDREFRMKEAYFLSGRRARVIRGQYRSTIPIDRIREEGKPL